MTKEWRAGEHSSRRPSPRPSPPPSSGERERYRRALYTFRFRSVPYPALQAFDVPNGDYACVRRLRSNTPLQALTALNEPVFMDCARALAWRLAEVTTDSVEAVADGLPPE